jgi:CheY-like chemotaxis protein
LIQNSCELKEIKMAQKLILWLEDRPKDAYRYLAICKDLGFEVKMVATAMEFLEILESNSEKICLIIVDLMLRGISNLESIGIDDSDTSAGFNAGWVIIERVLQPGSKMPYSHIPVTILSIRTPTEDDISRLDRLRNRGGTIDYIEKSSINSEGKSGVMVFQQYIDKINKNCR